MVSIFTILLLCASNFIVGQVDLKNPDYLNTNFIRQYDEVKKSLISNDQFKAVLFESDDEFELGGLLYEDKAAECNIIYFGGWFPGRKEGGLPFWPMVKDRKKKCNFLFVDVRGHGDSEGSFLWSTLRYGVNEHKDLRAAIKYMSRVSNNKPTIIIGVCAGAFHAIHALQRKDLSLKYNVVGMIFDSGWPSVMHVARTAALSLLKEDAFKRIFKLKKISCSECKDEKKCCSVCKKKLKKSFLYQLSSGFLSIFITAIHTCLIRPMYFLTEMKTNLFDKIDKITIPMLVVHAESDEYVPYDMVQKLFKKHKKNVKMYIVKDCKHSCMNLKYHDQYKTALNKFIDNVLIN